MDVSIIIPNYNGKKLLEKNLPKIIAAVTEYKAEKKEIVITDDASNDESVAFLKNFILERKTDIPIRVLENSQNKGFSTNANRGVTAAKGEIVVLLNSDVFPEKDFLAPLLSHFNDPDVFGVGCMDKSIENDKIVPRGRGVGKWQRGFLIHQAGSVDKSSTLWASGGSSAFKKEIWEKLGGFDSLYNPFYWEDIDLSYRALKSGFKVVFEPTSIVIHEHEKGAIKSFYRKEKILSIAYRNQFIFVWKNITDVSLVISHVVWLPFHILSSVLRGDIEFFKGFLKALILFPKVFNHRLICKKLFTKSDQEILEKLQK